jgi:HD-GYP domain-containing protein (c-di-GMP phosphodiesterase class II)
MAAAVENMLQNIDADTAPASAGVDKLETMIQLSALMNSTLETEEVRERAIEAASTLVNCEAVSLLLMDRATGQLYFDIALGAGADRVKNIKLEKGQGIAGWVAEQKKPIIVGDAQNDPRLFKKADQKSGFRTRNMLCVPVSTPTSLIGVLQAINKRDTTFDDNDARLLTAFANQIAVALENVRLYDDLKDSLYSVVQVLAETIEQRDPFSTGHAKRVSQYCVSIGKQLGLSKQQLVNLKLAGLLHDVGTLGIPDGIMQKKTRLTEEEQKKVMNHMNLGVDIIKNVKLLKQIQPAIKFHHEHFDGSGPFAMKGYKIPLFARIIAVADAFDAMTNKRPYRLACGYDAAMAELKAKCGIHYDPKIVKAFFDSKASIAARKHPLLPRR